MKALLQLMSGIFPVKVCLSTRFMQSFVKEGSIILCLPVQMFPTSINLKNYGMKRAYNQLNASKLRSVDHSKTLKNFG
ncbi:MAG: hypothetical protein VXY89_16835, partial [SAR324 cluster bacterium]|nr:hypothetical protein [SAR324 cluster bacterium]